MVRTLMLLMLLGLTGPVMAEDDWATLCKATAEKAETPFWVSTCDCLGEGIAKGANREQLLKILAAPRGQKQAPIQEANATTQQLVGTCLQALRGQGPGPGPGLSRPMQPVPAPAQKDAPAAAK